MSKEDDKPLIQTRTGIATGQANERQMLADVGDTFSFRTAVRLHADGSETRLRTRNGMPEFVTTKPETEEDEDVPLFLETGSTQYPSAMTIYNYHGLADGQGRWWFLVAPTANWLGYIKNSLGKQWALFNKKLYKLYGGATPPEGAALYDGMISPATSIPIKGATNSSWIDAMLTKRKAMVSCPASMFSGKMRLFMQAKYGKILTKTQTVDGHYEIESDGGFGVRVDGLLLSNLGGVGAGIFTTQDNNHFLLKISGADVTVFKMEPIKEHDELVKKLRSRLNKTDPALSAEEREQVEAYLFAATRIKPPYYKVYSGVLPATTPIVYGWSFNWTGNKADIISITTSGSGLDTHFLSTHYTLDITHWKTDEGDQFGFSYSTVSQQHWRDWRGSDHIFTPDYGDGGRMVWFSMNNTYTYAGSGKFHCFYQKDGTLVTASYTQNAGNTQSVWHETDATWPGAGGDQTVHTLITNYVVQGRRLVTSKTWSNYSSGTAAFTTGNEVFGGTYQVGTCRVEERYHGMGCAAPPQIRPMKESVVSIGQYGCGHAISGWAGPCQIYLDEPYTYKSEYFRWTEEDLGTMSDVHIANETRIFYTTVIPFFDCCAVFNYARDSKFRGVVNITRSHITNYNYTNGSMAIMGAKYTHPFTGEVLCSYPDLIGNDYYNTDTQVYSQETFAKDLGSPLYTLGITHFHGYESVVPTDSEAMLVTLFYVNQYYPYVDAQIWTTVNAGGSSAKAEVYNPDQYRRWTGWV